jgi:aromatic-L-amino-acid decarboxylase
MMKGNLTLDPDDWEEFRRLAHRMVDDMLDHLATLRDQPVWTPMPPAVRTALDEPLPIEGEGAERVYQSFTENVLPYPNGNLHPRFFGWVQGNGTPLGMMADMLAAGITPHMAGFNQAPALVEERVIRWLVELMGFPESADGVLTGGGTMANTQGLAVARNMRAGFDIREAGLSDSGRRLTVYASTETHGWLGKAVELLGLGRRSLRQVRCGADLRVDVSELRRMLDLDREAGLEPFCVVGNAGTVNTGATDDLRALATVCRDASLWFHVDGAFGALARWSERLRPIVDGIEQADSVAFDLHKWMYQPFTVACLLVRAHDAQLRTFAASASYLASAERGVVAGGLPFADRGLELTRPFRALKVWMSLKAHGVAAIARVIEQNVDQAAMLARLVDGHPELELVAPVPLNIVCFRFAPPAAEPGALNRLNQELLLQLQESGIAVPSSTILDDRFALRCAFVNHRTRTEDVEALVDAVLRIGRTIWSEMAELRV